MASEKRTTSDVELEMKFDMNVLEHLGLKNYTTLPAVVSEYVANAWDAWATEVEIQIPEDQDLGSDYEITITDDGFGMTEEEINEKFLIVGRNRRVSETDDHDELKDTVEKDGEKRDVMGRKGIGKLAGFGVAKTINIWTCRDGTYTEFEMNIEDMKSKLDDNRPDVKEKYKPDIISVGEADPGTEGTIISLSNLKYTQRPSDRYVKQRLARRFSVLNDEFTVEVNGEKIDPDQRNIKNRCQFTREFDEVELGDDEYEVNGWIGTFRNTVDDEIGSGVVVMARGKMVQEPFDFNAAAGGTSGQAALSYLVGEVEANWLDKGDRDQVSTDRNSAVWDEHPASLLYEFLQNEIQDFCRKWPEKRRDEKLEQVKDEKPYERYIEPLDSKEKDLADSFLGQLAEGTGFDESALEEMAQYVSSGVKQRHLRNLLEEINESDTSDPSKIIDLFREYEVMDAMNSLRLIKSRLRAIQKFGEFVDTNAREVPDIHDYLVRNSWLLDPTWAYLNDEAHLRDSLKGEYPDDEEEGPDRRIDFICLGDTNSIKIIEIKRPNVTIGINELSQLKDYVGFIRRHHGDGKRGGRDVEGYVIGKKLADSEKAQDEYERRMKPDDMYVRTYEDLRVIAERSHKKFINELEQKVDVTGSSMLESQLDGAKDEFAEVASDMADVDQ